MLTVVALLAVGVIPAMGMIDDARGVGAVREIERRLVLARSHAMTTGQASGLRIALPQGRLEMQTVESGGEIETMTGFDGYPMRASTIEEMFPGTAVAAVRHGDGSTGSGTIWFAFDGEPHTRAWDGAYVAPFTQDAHVEVAGATPVYIRRGTGLVER